MSQVGPGEADPKIEPPHRLWPGGVLSPFGASVRVQLPPPPRMCAVRGASVTRPLSRAQMEPGSPQVGRRHASGARDGQALQRLSRGSVSTVRERKDNVRSSARAWGIITMQGAVAGQRNRAGRHNSHNTK